MVRAPVRPPPAPTGPTDRAGAVGLAPDPVLLGVVAVAAGVMAAILLGRSVAVQVVLFWALQPPLDVAFCVLCLRVARSPDQPAPTGRFWRTMGLAGLLFTVGDLVQTVATVRRPVAEAAAAGVPQTCFTLAGVGCVVWVMLTLPTGVSGRAKARMWLDAATVMAAAGVFAWYFSVGSGPGRSVDVASALGGSALTLVAVFAVVKLLLGGAAPFTVQAGAAGATSAALIGVAIALTPPLGRSGQLALLLVLRMVPSVLLAVTPRIQELQLRANPAALQPRPARPYSRLPYVAVAATQTLLITILAGLHPATRVWGVLVGVEVIIGLVVVRQLAAFRDNAQLLLRVRHQAWHDPLTQLPNRLLFEERLRAALSRPPGGPAGAALLLIDLDDFKAVNDTHGHHVGDGLLAAVAARLRACARAGDTVTRLGGDEFGLLLPAATVDVAAAVADRLHAAFDDPVSVDGHELRIRASIGLAVGRPDDPEGLLRAADAAMYAAKRRRKAGVRGDEGHPGAATRLLPA